MTRVALARIGVGLLMATCAQACAVHSGAARARQARPAQKSLGATIEGQDRALSAALIALRLAPSAASHRAVAAEYRRLRIDDQAFDHLTAATRLDATDAAAYDGLARIWRDWGYPQLGLADATRAVFHAPASAEARNTRGTLLAAVGDTDAARRDFEAALELNPDAAYAAANLKQLDRRSSPSRISRK